VEGVGLQLARDRGAGSKEVVAEVYAHPEGGPQAFVEVVEHEAVRRPNVDDPLEVHAGSADGSFYFVGAPAKPVNELPVAVASVVVVETVRAGRLRTGSPPGELRRIRSLDGGGE
jgi:hypothetical protein